MPFIFFQIPLQHPEIATEALNGFLRSHRILSVDRRWVDQGENSFWAFCVDYLDYAPGSKSKPGSLPQSERKSIDYRELLNETEFRLFVAIRDLRKNLAERDNVPLYAILSNEQMAEIAKRKVTNKSQLSTIPGIGESKLKKYGTEILNLLNTWTENGQTSRSLVSEDRQLGESTGSNGKSIT